jgi:hypothetical protein
VVSLTDPATWWQIAVSLAILIVPGAATFLALRRLLGATEQADWDLALLAGIGLSIALWPLLLLYSTLVRLPFFPAVPLLVLALSAAYLAYELWRHARLRSKDRESRSFESIDAHGTLIAITVIVLLLRVADAQGLAVPLFGDSLHHTMLAELILRGGSVPSGYSPFVPVETFTYHFGFHTLAATLAQLTSTPSHVAVLLIGQVMNALSVPLAYLLNVTLFRSKLTGLFAAALTGFISLMPAFYVNWGRYTQLVGQLLLMVALTFLVRVLARERRKSDLVVLGLCVAGLVVVHYRILIFFGLFLLPAVAILAYRVRRSAFRITSRVSAAVLVGLLIALPWIINLTLNYLPGLNRRLGTVTGDYLAEYNNLGTLTFYMGRILPTLALIGLGVALWALFRGDRQEDDGEGEPVQANLNWAPLHALVVVSWVALLVLSLYVRPGAIGSYTVAIMLFIPLSALGGYGLGWLTGRLAERRTGLRAWAAVSLLVIAPTASVLLGTARVADPGSYNYLQPADREAFGWIRERTPPDSIFLISSEFSYNGRAVTASDGGMWIPLLTGRGVSVPALNSWMERPTRRDFFELTRALAAYSQPLTPTTTLRNPTSNQEGLVERGILSEPHALTDREALALMKELGVTHVYSGSSEGWSESRLSLDAIRSDAEHFEPLYSAGGVEIYRVRYDREP